MMICIARSRTAARNEKPGKQPASSEEDRQTADDKF